MVNRFIFNVCNRVLYVLQSYEKTGEKPKKNRKIFLAFRSLILRWRIPNK